MRFWPWFLLLIAAALVSGALLTRWLPPGLRPDLLLLMALYAGLRAPRPDALRAAWVAGLLKDLLSAGPLGLYALLYLGVAFAVGRLVEWLSARSALVQGVTAFAAFLLTEGVALLALAVRANLWPSGAVGEWFTGALVTAAAAPFFVRIADRLLGAPSRRRHARSIG